MDEDLTGDDLKYVSYTIHFTKRDFETTLQAERLEMLDYPITAEAFAALKVTDFLERVLVDGIPWPSEWKERPGTGYPAPEQRVRQIPVDDRKYLQVTVSVKARRPRDRPEADKAAVEMLRKIREQMG